MYQDTLERERQLNNLIDQVSGLQERLARLEERIMALDSSGGSYSRDDETGIWYQLVVKTLFNEVNNGTPQLFLRKLRRGTR